jgi:RNA polymerase-binding transcription factor
MDEERARSLLAQNRERVQKLLADTTQREDEEELSHADQHMADDAQFLADEEVDEGLRERLQEELEAIERAERRLAEGSYGRSVESGEPIPDARLEAIPWAERTAEEQTRYERGG